MKYLRKIDIGKRLDEFEEYHNGIREASKEASNYARESIKEGEKDYSVTVRRTRKVNGKDIETKFTTRVKIS